MESEKTINGQIQIVFDEDLYKVSIIKKTYETNKTYHELQTLWEALDQKIIALETKTELALKEFIASSPENENDEALFERLVILDAELFDLKEQRFVIEQQMKTKH